MFPYRNSVRRNIEVSFTSVFCVPAIPLDDALSLPESNGKVVGKIVIVPNFTA